MKQMIKLVTLITAAAIAGYGCGNSSVGNDPVSNAPGEAKTAKVNLSFAFPEEVVEKALISDAATHITVHVKQWAVDELKNMAVVNTDKGVVAKSGTNSITFDLLPTWTRICSTQWKGDPNDTTTSKKLETACTFGKLNVGANTVALTMVRGEWTLGTAFNGIDKFTLSRNVTGYYSDYESFSDAYDGSPEFMGSNGPFDMPTQAINNWGSVYQPMFSKGGTYEFLTNGGGLYHNSFSAANSQEPNLMIGGGEEVQGAFGNVSTVTGFVMGGFAKKTVSGVLTEEKQIIDFQHYHSYDWAPNCSSYYNGNQYVYDCTKPVLRGVKVETSIQNAAGTNVTATFVDPCQVRFTSGSAIAGCAGDQSSVTFGTYSTHNYKLTTTVTTQGADICKDGVAKDVSGNLVCVDHNYNSQYMQNCSTSNMTYDMYQGRCEKTIQQACVDLGGTYSESVQECTASTLYTGGNSICSNITNGYSYSYTDNVGVLAGCYNYNYTGTAYYTYTCWNGGTFNDVKGRCEQTLEQACYHGVQDPGESYNATTKTCTETGEGYLNSINFTPVTMTGVGKLPANLGTGVTTSSTKKNNTIKW